MKPLKKPPPKKTKRKNNKSVLQGKGLPLPFFIGMKKIVFITAGDPLGIGPEITVKALRSPRVQAKCNPVVLGDTDALLKAGWTDNLGQLLPIDAPACSGVPHPTAAGGLASFKAVQTGIKLALQTGDPLVTAPISKQSWALAGISYTGHTELLRAQTNADGLMMFISGQLRCALVTEHFAIADLPRLLTKNKVQNAALHFVQALQKLGIKKPKIALCALNPHAGDNGRFGTEENRVLSPAVKNLQHRGFLIQGPLPTDAAWLMHAHGQCDGLLCLYHDQALAPLKLAAKEPIVHLTAGLPFVRTSPTHGTAFDIAGKNKADPSSMESAILFAIQKS